MNRRDALAIGGLAILLVAYLAPMARIGVDPHHDGSMLKPALDVLSGQVLFRDTFMQYGAMSTYLQVGALWVQRTLLSVRLLTVAAYAGSLVFLYAAWRLILPRALTIVSCGLFILFVPAYEREPWNHEYWLLLPWSSVFALLFQSLGLYALFRMIRGESPERWALVLGLACASVFWCRQPVGGLMAGALLVIWPALFWTGWTPRESSPRAILVRLAGGFLTVNILLLGGMALTGALPAWWYQNIIWPARWSQSMDWGDTLRMVIHPGATAGLVLLGLALGLPGVAKRCRPGLSAVPGSLYFLGLAGVLAWQHERLFRALAVREGGWTALIPLVVGWQACRSISQALVKRGAPREMEYYLIAAFAALGLGSLAQYYPMADDWHVFYSLAPVFGLFVFVLWRSSGWSAGAVTLLCTAVFLPAVCAKLSVMRQALDRPLVTLEQPAVLRGMRVAPEQARSFGQIADTVALIERHRPGLPGAMIGNNALYLCFPGNLANPTPYYVTWRGLADQADNLQRWDYINRTRPMLILQDARWEAVNDFYRRARYVPLLYVPAEALEIAVPQELAEAMGVKIYGLFGIGRPGVRL